MAFIRNHQYNIKSENAGIDITQNALAEMLGIGKLKLNQILNGKREPDVQFLKVIHKKSGIDGNFILESV